VRILWKPYSPNRGEIGFERRRFLSTSLGAVAGGVLAGRLPAWADDLRSFAPPADQTPQFQTDDATLTTAYQLALSALTRNTLNVAGFSSPDLIEGSVYRTGRVLPADGPVDGRVYGVGSERLFASGSCPVGFSLAALWARQEGTQLEWNCRLPGNSSEAAFSAATKTGTALLRQTRKEAILTLVGKNILSVKGTARIVTDAQGKPLRIVGTGRTGFRGRSILAEWKEKENPRTAECRPVDLNAGSDQSSDASKRFQIQSDRDGESSEGWVAGKAFILITRCFRMRLGTPARESATPQLLPQSKSCHNDGDQLSSMSTSGLPRGVSRAIFG